MKLLVNYLLNWLQKTVGFTNIRKLLMENTINIAHLLYISVEVQNSKN